MSLFQKKIIVNKNYEMFLFGIKLETTYLFQILNVKTCGSGIIYKDINSPYILLGQEKKRKRIFWSDFGGKMENNESIWQTAVRETKEETIGLIKFDEKISKIKPKHMHKCYYMTHNVTFYKYKVMYLKKYIIYLIEGDFFNSSKNIKIDFNKRKRFAFTYQEQEKQEISWLNLYHLIRKNDTYRLGFRCRDILYFLFHSKYFRKYKNNMYYHSEHSTKQNQLQELRRKQRFVYRMNL